VFALCAEADTRFILHVDCHNSLGGIKRTTPLNQRIFDENFLVYFDADPRSLEWADATVGVQRARRAHKPGAEQAALRRITLEIPTVVDGGRKWMVVVMLSTVMDVCG
jgi:hypothetical protein